MRKPVFKLFCLLLFALVLGGCGGSLRYEIRDAEVTITDCFTGADGDLEIPAQIEGLPVTRIKPGAFFLCRGLTSITLPESVASIGKNAFGECSSLTSITIPDSVTSIGDYAFFGCTSLTSIVVASGNSSFKSLDGVVFSNDETELLIYPAGKSGDYGIPDSVTSIGSYAFQFCRSLTSVTIPEGVTSIGEEAFVGCYSLTSISIPDSVTSIGQDAFADCYGLTPVTIPKAFHSEDEASRLGLDELWPDDFALPDSSSK